MTRVSPLALAAAFAALATVACEGHEIAVFDVPDLSGGTAGSGGAGGSVAAAGAGMAGTVAAIGGAGSAAVGPTNDAGTAGVAPSTGGVSGSDSGGMSGTGGTAPESCGSIDDCSPGWFCEKPSCDSPMGVCEPSPLFPNPDPMPVCGCNGVTYWNDDIRRQAGAELASQGECRATACMCDVGSDCKVQFASCNHLVAPGEMCSHGKGACWVLPAQCMPSSDTLMWQECTPPGDPPGRCLDTCQAIASEKAFAQPHRGMMCN